MFSRCNILPINIYEQGGEPEKDCKSSRDDGDHYSLLDAVIIRKTRMRSFKHLETLLTDIKTIQFIYHFKEHDEIYILTSKTRKINIIK